MDQTIKMTINRFSQQTAGLIIKTKNKGAIKRWTRKNDFIYCSSYTTFWRKTREKIINIITLTLNAIGTEEVKMWETSKVKRD